MFGLGRWTEETTQVRRRAVRAPRWYIARTILWTSAFWLGLILLSLVAAWAGH